MLVVLTALAARPAAAQEAPIRVVVLPFEAQAGVKAADAATLTELVRSAIAVTNEFALIEDQASSAILQESGFMAGSADPDEASRILAERLNAAYALAGAMSAEADEILLSVRLVDAATARVIFVHRMASTTATIHRDARLFAEGIANEVVAMTAGATIANIDRLLSLGRLDEASRKLDSARLRSSGKPEQELRLLDALEDRIDAELAERAYRLARAAVSQAGKAGKTGKDAETRDALMASAREYGNEALFLVPDDQARVKQRDRYLSFMRDAVMSYYASEDRSRRTALAARADELVKRGNPDDAIAAIDDFIQVAGERSIDKPIKAALDRAKAARADRFLSAAVSARSARDYSRAERLLLEAATAGIAPSRFASERARLETAQQSDESARVMAERLASSAWDPAARRPVSLSAGLDLVTVDSPTSTWPLGGLAALTRFSLTLSERVSGPILFDWRLSARAGSAEWAGNLDIGTTSVAYWKADAALGAGFTMAVKRFDLRAGIELVAGAAGFNGQIEAYGTMSPLERPLAPYLGAAIRAGTRFRPGKRYGFGIDLERSVTWSPGATPADGFTFGIAADLTL